LRALWDSADLEVSEAQLRAALDREETDAGRAEVLTQLARVELNRGRPEAAHELLGEAERLAGDDPVVRARLLLERGRVERRFGDAEEAKRLLEQACDAALAADQPFIAVDAIHSRALAGDMVAWTGRGLELADRYPGAAYWRGTLLLNLGEWQWEHALYDESFVNYRAALEAREQDSRNPGIREEARFGVGRALRALGRPDEAIPFLEEALAWAEATHPDWPMTEQFRAELEAARDG
jgi:tetratricopeptide (TPR) repeat protein